MTPTRTPPPAQAAEMLAANGRGLEALLVLNKAASAGDGDALFTLGLWRLGGRFCVRDIAAARALFRRAGEAGRIDGAIVHTNFLAAGVGGPADWPAAMKQLRRLATHDGRAATQLALIDTMQLSDDGAPMEEPGGEPVSEAPFVRRCPGLLTSAECEYLIDASDRMLTPSLVVEERSGRQVPHPIRSSDGATFPWLLANPAVHAINRRIAAISGTHVDQGEPLQILRYKPGQQYKPHFDAIAGLANQRIVTVITYLNNCYQGGETRFGQAGLTIKGRRGDAILFRNTGADGRADPLSEHAGLPVTSGVKLIATRWIRGARFDP